MNKSTIRQQIKENVKRTFENSMEEYGQCCMITTYFLVRIDDTNAKADMHSTLMSTPYTKLKENDIKNHVNSTMSYIENKYHSFNNVLKISLNEKPRKHVFIKLKLDQLINLKIFLTRVADEMKRMEHDDVPTLYRYVGKLETLIDNINWFSIPEGKLKVYMSDIEEDIIPMIELYLKDMGKKHEEKYLEFFKNTLK